MWHVFARRVASLLHLLQKINGCTDFLRLQYTNMDIANELGIPKLVRKHSKPIHSTSPCFSLRLFFLRDLAHHLQFWQMLSQKKWSPSDIGKEFIAFHHLHHTDFLVQGADMAHGLDHITGSWQVNIHGNSWLSYAWHLAWLDPEAFHKTETFLPGFLWHVYTYLIISPYLNIFNHFKHVAYVTLRPASHRWVTPASPFVRIMLAPSAIRRNASPRFRQPHTKGTWQGIKTHICYT